MTEKGGDTWLQILQLKGANESATNFAESMYSTKVPSFQLQGRPAHHSGRAGVEVLVAESQNSGSMPCQFGIETVVVTWDAGELEEDVTYRDEERFYHDFYHFLQDFRRTLYGNEVGVARRLGGDKGSDDRHSFQRGGEMESVNCLQSGSPPLPGCYCISCS